MRPPRSRNHTSSPSTITTRAPALRPGRCAPSPGHGRAAPYGLAGIGRREHDGLVGAALLVDVVEVGAQPVDGGRHRELGAAQRLDEVAALAPAGVLECAEHLVEHRESAGHTLGGALRQHAVAVEQQLGLEVGADGRFGFGRRERGPAARDGRLGRAGLGVRHAVAAQPRRTLPLAVRAAATTGAVQHRAHRGERVAGDPTRPDQFPQCGFELLRSRPRRHRRVAGRSTRRRARACP